jgi:hypothetical protein
VLKKAMSLSATGPRRTSGGSRLMASTLMFETVTGWGSSNTLLMISGRFPSE